MRWSLAQSLALMAVIAIVLALFTLLHDSQESLLYIFCGTYMAAMAIAIAANRKSSSSRFWLTFVVFAKLYLLVQLVVTVLNPRNLFIPHLLTIGVLLGFASAFTSLLIPQLIDPPVDSNVGVDEKSISQEKADVL